MGREKVDDRAFEDLRGIRNVFLAHDMYQLRFLLPCVHGSELDGLYTVELKWET